MNCKNVKNKIVDFLEERLSPEESTAFENHIRECKSCSGFLEEFKLVWQQLTAPEEGGLSPYFWTRLEGKISEYESKEKYKEKAAFNIPKLLQPVVYAAIILFGIVFGYKLGISYTEQSELKEEIKTPVYVETFDYIPEGSLGALYYSYYTEP